VRQVHQIAATLAIVAGTAAIVGLRLSRPERLFQNVTTDDVSTVLQAIELPSAELYPSTWLADAVAAGIESAGDAAATGRLAALAVASFLLFLVVASKSHFTAWVRAKETSAPVALGSGLLTGALDRATARLDPQVRAILGKEVRILTRDAAQWSQLFMMVALLFLYLYNIRMLPLQGDFRAVLVAYLNLGMTGFVIAATCLRFAYPSISAEGKQYWILESAPVSFRLLLWVKVLVYLVPLLFVGLLLTSLGNAILSAPAIVWGYTLLGAVLVSATLVAMGVGMGAASPDFKLENPLELAMSIGGFAYMALSMLYVGLMMFLMAKPMHGFMLRIWFGIDDTQSALAVAAPVAIALGVSLLLSVGPIEVANWRLVRRQV
jgi:ABC-2 type transport system permease protein